jgi:5-aminopentanamidase
MKQQLTVAVCQPQTAPPQQRCDNVPRAVELIARGATAGAELVVFPEHSPGPFLPGEDYDAMPDMVAATRQHRVAALWSRMEQCDDRLWRLVVYAHGADGEKLIRYERTHPATVPASDTGTGVAPGEELGLFDYLGVRFGIAVCSELWIPETSRCLALAGAEVILSPAGGHFTSLTSNWQVIARARAIENLCHVVLTNNLYGAESGAALIAGPENVLAAGGREEIFLATCNLERARWLRDHDDALAEPKPFDSIPGLLRARRPALYGALIEPRPDDFNYYLAGEQK